MKSWIWEFININIFDIYIDIKLFVEVIKVMFKKRGKFGNLKLG